MLWVYSFATQLIQHSSFLAMRPLCLAFEEMYESMANDRGLERRSLKLEGWQEHYAPLFSRHYLRFRNISLF
ncbi:hypothetical protein BC629DRAFT_1514034 [Irpex lacteus]|nr:hypothetical protein BC629DRAFT_1514034 [Irpex lacteus]